MKWREFCWISPVVAGFVEHMSPPPESVNIIIFIYECSSSGVGRCNVLEKGQTT